MMLLYIIIYIIIYVYMIMVNPSDSCLRMELPTHAEGLSAGHDKHQCAAKRDLKAVKEQPLGSK